MMRIEVRILGATLGITVAYLSLVVLIPLAATFLKTATLDWDQFVRAVTSPRVLASSAAFVQAQQQQQQ